MTFYLSDTILFKKPLQYEIYEPTYATYKVYAFNRGFIGGNPDGSYEDTPFFVGRIFISTTDTDVEIYLNDIIQTRRETQKVIKARFNEGFTLDDFKKVIDIKVKEWLDDKRMCQYLRPETLFGNKFEGYLNQKQTKLTTKDIADKIDWSDY